MKCGLLGRKLGHSYSPAIHGFLGNYEYSLFEIKPEELADFLKNSDFEGINVTMPYKKAVIPYLDDMTPIAKELGAVNTIVRQNNKLIGSNTDYYGFQSMLEKSGLQPAGKKCLILGSGGASQVVQAVLKRKQAKAIVISRTGEHNYQNLQQHADAAIIVNTTPVGMYPNCGQSPVHLDLFPQLEGVLDLVYNPARTQLLLDAQRRSIPTMNGLWMLIAQAKQACELFSGCNISEEMIGIIHEKLRSQMENIVLIGMPGCGKSTIGKLLAEKTGKTFVDTDVEIEKIAQKNIPCIFAEDGETAFRALETQVLETYGKQSGLVIATGGGCVTKPENETLLRQNGTIFWLQRDLEQLATNGRPLSKDLERMYQIRKPLYEAFSDFSICNHSDPQNTAQAIMEVFYENSRT